MARLGQVMHFIQLYCIILFHILFPRWLDKWDTLGCYKQRYKFLDSKINISWIEAQHECELVGGYLVG